MKTLLLSLMALLMLGACKKEEAEKPTPPGYRSVRFVAECAHCKVAWTIGTQSSSPWTNYVGGLDTTFLVYTGVEAGFGIDDYPAGGTRGTLYVNGLVVDTEYDVRAGGWPGGSIHVSAIMP